MMTIDVENNIECCICLESLDDYIILVPCEHKIHENCFIDLVNNSIIPYKCPLCRVVIAVAEKNRRLNEVKKNIFLGILASCALLSIISIVYILNL